MSHHQPISLYRRWILCLKSSQTSHSFECIAPDDAQAYTDWQNYETSDQAIDAAHQFIDQDFNELSQLMDGSPLYPGEQNPAIPPPHRLS